MDIQENKFLVYENWRAENKAVVHKSSCGYANEGHVRHTNSWILNNHSPNDRWFGYFNKLDEAIAFASLLPNRKPNLCGHCLRNEKQKI